MKKIYLFLFFSAISGTLFGQIKYGPKIGINLSGANLSSPSPTENTNVSSTATLRTSYCLGAMAEARVGDAFAVQLSLMISNKGYNFIEVLESKTEFGNNSSAQTALLKSSVVTNRGTRNLLYLDIPVAFVYKKDLGIGKVFGGLGGYFSYNIWGVTKEKNTYVVGSSFDLSLSSLNGTYDLTVANELSRTDFGGFLTAGLEFDERTQVAVNYNLGLSDTNPGLAKVYNRTVSITVTYLFGDN
ncbi:MAG: PorT family protein [Verrucomicrobia bacterium]|nr:PorT family protein [Cytophagales bacterium]